MSRRHASPGLADTASSHLTTHPYITHALQRRYSLLVKLRIGNLGRVLLSSRLKPQSEIGPNFRAGFYCTHLRRLVKDTMHICAGYRRIE